jgi:cysteine desulfurase
MLPYLKEEFSNASSIHAFGRRAAIGINEARQKVAGALGCRPEEVVFTGCGTEADNLAIKGVAYAHRERGDHIITTRIEHHAVLHTCQYLEKQGFQVTYLPVDEYGMVDPDDVRKGTRLDSLLHGGHHERNRRAGTENVAGIVGLGRAVELALAEMEEEAHRQATLREWL